MIRMITGIVAVWILAVVSFARAMPAADPITDLEIVPDKIGFTRSFADNPIIIRSCGDAANYFSKTALQALGANVDFKQQLVLIFAWQGSGGDALVYNVGASFPERIAFLLKPGRTRDLRKHSKVYALRSDVTWHVVGRTPQISAGGATVSIKLQVPDGGWRVRIMQVYQSETGLLAVSELYRTPGMSIQVISTVQDSILVQAPELPVKHFVLGRTWGWENREPHIFLNDRTQLAENLDGAKLIYQHKD